MSYYFIVTRKFVSCKVAKEQRPIFATDCAKASPVKKATIGRHKELNKPDALVTRNRLILVNLWQLDFSTEYRTRINECRFEN